MQTIVRFGGGFLATIFLKYVKSFSILSDEPTYQFFKQL